MPFELSLIVGSTTYSLSDGNPYKLQDAVGLGLPPVQRFSSRYPRQDGYDDSGFVLEPRVITLALSFVAATAAALDGHRDTLSRMFSPGAAAVLQVTRDDGEVRRIDVVPTAAPVITLTPEHAAGKLHRAVVQLRAADPIWYSPTPGTVTFGTTDTSIWYLASSKIEAAAVMEASTNVVGETAWNWGTATQRLNDGEYELTIAMRFVAGSTTSTLGSVISYPARVSSTAPGFGNSGIDISNTGTAQPLSMRAWRAVAGSGGGTRYEYFDPPPHGGTISVVWSAKKTRWTGYLNEEKSFDALITLDGTYQVNLLSPNTKWLYIAGTPPGTLLYAAAYDRFLNDEQARALANAMGGTVVDYALGATVPYAGSYDDLPVLTLTGPLGDPVVTNVTTGQKLDFTGSTIAAGIVYTIDLGRDTLSVVDQGGTIHTSKLTDDSDLGSWALAAGQSNYVQVTASTSGTASQAQIVYRNRYVSY